MLVPISWLKNYVPVSDSPEELAHKLTMAGIEIGDVEVVGADWEPDSLVVGHVLKVDPHPNADRLKLPTVGIAESVSEAVRRLSAKWCAEPSVHGGKKRPKDAILII